LLYVFLYHRKKGKMETKELAAKQELAELSNKLFMYTDLRQWPMLLQEVFANDVWFDMSSAGGGEAKFLPAATICDMWKQGFEGLDAVHHQAGHYIITVQNDTADIYAYATASHYKKAATNGQTRIFVGSYDLKAQQTPGGWRITQFKYNLKYIDGNTTLE
jgi:hypothetical protein